jgi:chaperonin GroEL (HSP60 family)
MNQGPGVCSSRRGVNRSSATTGITIAKEFALKDPDENLGAQLLRGAAERTGDAVGDGTTTATLLAHAGVAEGMRNIARAARHANRHSEGR